MKAGILITGGAGLLAANWAAAVKHRYAVTLGLHNRQIAMEDVDGCVMDLGSTAAIAAVLEETGANIVIHTAAMTSVDDCESAPQLAHRTNVEIARNVARACQSNGAKLVHISTDHVFSGVSSMMEETAAVSPINVYARTKAEAECAVLQACPTAIVARTNFFGWGLPYRKSFSDSIIESLREGREVGLFRDAYFTPILMETLINAAHELIEAGNSGVFHVVGDERLSKYEFGLRIAYRFGLDASLVKPTLLAERRDLAPRPLDLSLDNSKLRAAVAHGIGDVDSQLARLLDRERFKLNLEMAQ